MGYLLKPKGAIRVLVDLVIRRAHANALASVDASCYTGGIGKVGELLDDTQPLMRLVYRPDILLFMEGETVATA
uniref:Uncharacterized protein n=1 Tax=Peronospora matthiolae TaxID=2874970 RepID=A0AAV1U9Y5_9STRA